MGSMCFRKAAALYCALVMAAPAQARDKIFFIGPMKTGTTSLAAMYTARGYRACHGECNGQPWHTASTSRAAKAIVDSHDTFMDHGDHANFKWLAKSYPTARFVLNTRELKSWLISRADHARRNRVAGHCAPFGDKCPAASSNFVSNSNETIASWARAQARHQMQALHFFASDARLRNRFAVIDVEGMSQSQLNHVLDWVSRSDLTKRRTSKLVMKAGDVPNEHGRSTFHGAAPDANSFRHPPDVKHIVEGILRRVGCPRSTWDALIYSKCNALEGGRRSSSTRSHVSQHTVAKRGHSRSAHHQRR
mmetsp:Transcript_23220/g.62940  ORF Transcript_23220/g.62940 Transcript_23220/m.62940 type:complete len:306 (-) Transcript_23220:114-1031(-)